MLATLIWAGSRYCLLKWIMTEAVPGIFANLDTGALHSAALLPHKQGTLILATNNDGNALLSFPFRCLSL